MVNTSAQRSYLPAELSVSAWGDIAPFFEELEQRSINSATELERWLRNLSEV